MPDDNAESKKPKDARPIQLLKQRRGGVPEELITRHRAHTQIRKKITAVLKNGPGTVPEVAAVTELPTHEVLWHLMGMKKYGLVAEGNERDGYYEYALQEKNK